MGARLRKESIVVATACVDASVPGRRSSGTNPAVASPAGRRAVTWVVVTGPAAGRLRGGGSSAIAASAAVTSSVRRCFRHLLPVAVEQRAFQRIQQVEAGLEAGALDAHERFDRADRLQVLARAQADLAQPCRATSGRCCAACRRVMRLLMPATSTNACAIASSPAWSSASKRSGDGLSRSSTPISSPSAHQRHHQFRTRGRIAGDVAGERVDVGDALGRARARRRAAHALVERNAHAGRQALERADHQFGAVEEIEADPVELGSA